MSTKFYQIVVPFFILVLQGCGKDSGPAGTVSGAAGPAGADSTSHLVPLPKGNGQPGISAAPDVPGLHFSIVTPEGQRQHWYSSHVAANRDVPSKTIDLKDFKRTLEETNLTLSADISAGQFAAGPLHIEILSEGRSKAKTSGTVETDKPLQLSLKFKTPKLSKADRENGMKLIGYDVVVTSSEKTIHVPFSIIVYDSTQPTYVEPRPTECVIYNLPERASGCYQNRTRTTQDVDFADSSNVHHETSVQVSGGLQLSVQIVTASFGVQKTTTNATDVGHSSDIHFTNCIECASVIYRQVVDTVRMGDVYSVMADGSLSLEGQATVTSHKVAYEFTSTGSESKNYNCDIPSKLPVGQSPECSTILNGDPAR